MSWLDWLSELADVKLPWPVKQPHTKVPFVFHFIITIAYIAALLLEFV